MRSGIYDHRQVQALHGQVFIDSSFRWNDGVDGPFAASMCHNGLSCNAIKEGAVHMNISMIGLDIAKSVFQVHGIDAAGAVVVRRKLRRGQMQSFFSRLEPCGADAWWPVIRPHAESRLRPFALRALITRRPPGVFMRARKP